MISKEAAEALQREAKADEAMGPGGRNWCDQGHPPFVGAYCGPCEDAKAAGLK